MEFLQKYINLYCDTINIKSVANAIQTSQKSRLMLGVNKEVVSDLLAHAIIDGV